MPHAVIEYSRPLEQKIVSTGMLSAIHKALLASGEFGEKDIKVRMYACDHALVAGQKQNFIHITVYLLSGRSKETKKKMNLSLLKTVEGFKLDLASISVDARDLDREVYSKTAG